ncbi:hypothetical protein X777_14016 [Ooceraea biroi]|uniref:FHOD1 N-terminal GTPase-binding domain-containing protein n=1 Tax=Ooceraea biroi TaxID=2015173 RepID=A0A026WXJ0_OOCBI|nr:hypothetical protein X777_14016 [Ooceraea biroi]
MRLLSGQRLCENRLTIAIEVAIISAARLPAAYTQNSRVSQRIVLPVLQLDDTALQLYKGGDYGAYLDLEASINEQQEEFEGFHER